MFNTSKGMTIALNMTNILLAIAKTIIFHKILADYVIFLLRVVGVALFVCTCILCLLSSMYTCNLPKLPCGMLVIKPLTLINLISLKLISKNIITLPEWLCTRTVSFRINLFYMICKHVL
jgi:hypothetical protein